MKEWSEMRRRLAPLLPLVALILAVGAACAGAGGIEFETDPRQTQAINVINQLAHPMVIWFDDGDGERLLGTVAAGSRDRFVIAEPGVSTLSVVARDEAQTETVRRTVTLVPGGTVDVVIN